MILNIFIIISIISICTASICNNNYCYEGVLNKASHTFNFCIYINNHEYMENLYVSSDYSELFKQFSTFNLVNNIYEQPCINLNKIQKAVIYLLDSSYFIVGDQRVFIKPEINIIWPLSFNLDILFNIFKTNITFVKYNSEQSFDQKITNNFTYYEEYYYLFSNLSSLNNNQFQVDTYFCTKQLKCIYMFKYCFNDESCIYYSDIVFYKKIRKNLSKAFISLSKKLIPLLVLISTIFGISFYISNYSESFSNSKICTSTTIIPCTVHIIITLVCLTLIILLYIFKCYFMCKKNK